MVALIRELETDFYTPLEDWTAVCPISAIVPFTGVAAHIKRQQIAIFRLSTEECYSISNYDPFSKAYVLSRGLVGDKNGVLKVASPIYKHNFDLKTGQCLEDALVKLAVWETRVVDGVIQVRIP